MPHCTGGQQKLAHMKSPCPLTRPNNTKMLTGTTMSTRSRSKSTLGRLNPCSVSWRALPELSQKYLLLERPLTFKSDWTTSVSPTLQVSTLASSVGWMTLVVGRVLMTEASTSSLAQVRHRVTPSPDLRTLCTNPGMLPTR